MLLSCLQTQILAQGRASFELSGVEERKDLQAIKFPAYAGWLITIEF